MAGLRHRRVEWYPNLGGRRPLWTIPYLKGLLAKVTSDVTGGRFPTVPAVYYPHASLAYDTANGVDHRPMKQWLSDCEGGPVSFPVTRISLVAQCHDLRFITWRHILDVDLGGEAEARP